MTIEIVGDIDSEAIIRTHPRDRSLTTATPISREAHQALIDLATVTLDRSRTRAPDDVSPDSTIWMFWGGPLPKHLAACIGKTEQLSGTCELIVVEPDTARTFAPDLPSSWEALPSWAHKSDVLAAYLLHRYGGLYVDVDTIAVAPIDALVDTFQAGKQDFVAYLNASNRPSVGVMWSRSRSAVATAYKDGVDKILDEGTDDLSWVALGTPLLAEAFDHAGENIHDLESMLGRVALFYWPAWRTFTLRQPALDPLVALSPGGGASLVFVALFHSRSGPGIEARSTETIFDALLRWGPSTVALAAKRTLSPVTFVIKTFNRPRTIAYTIERLREQFCDAPVVVVEDSATDHVADLSMFGVAHLLLEFDAGLSRGRNIGISHVETEFFVLHDDDQFPAEDFDLTPVLDVLRENPGLDAAGGREDDTPHVCDSFEVTKDRVLVQHRRTPWSTHGEGSNAIDLFHMVQNQTLWRTANFRSKRLRWTPQLKVGEHVDFFFRYRGRIKIMFAPALHFANVPQEVCDQDEAATDYAHYRQRQNEMWQLFKSTNDIRRIEVKEASVAATVIETPIQRWARRLKSRARTAVRWSGRAG